MAAGLLIGGWSFGWKVAKWQSDAALLPGARKEIQAQQERRVADALAAHAILVKEVTRVANEAKTGASVKVVQRTIREYVQTNHNCDIPDPVAGRLQSLREGRDVPEAAP